jgi:hypothetical protein
MDMNVTTGVRGYIIRENVSCLFVVLCFIGLAGFPAYEVISSECDVLTTFYYRVFEFKKKIKYDVPGDVINRNWRSWQYYVYKIPGIITIVRPLAARLSLD